MAYIINNARCNYCKKKSEIWFKNGVGKCPYCHSEDVVKIATKTGIQTVTSPSRYT